MTTLSPKELSAERAALETIGNLAKNRGQWSGYACEQIEKTAAAALAEKPTK